ncbi:MAG: hypothetical protein AB7E12_16505, partial [Burkholderiaceae bacterium]
MKTAAFAAVFIGVQYSWDTRVLLGISELCALAAERTLASHFHEGAAMKNRQESQRGQGMTEYVIVVALVAVAAIAVYQLFGQVVRSQTAAMAMELAGED